MRNRYGDEYEFVRLDDNKYIVSGELKYWRFGGKENQDTIDFNDLGYVDPSGGPFMAVGSMIEGRKITRISADDHRVVFEVA